MGKMILDDFAGFIGNSRGIVKHNAYHDARRAMSALPEEELRQILTAGKPDWGSHPQYYLAVADEL